jgi:hypothetical protein
VSRTFKPGAGEFLHDPVERAALNMWKPFDRSLVVSDPGAVELFTGQVEYLFGPSAPRFIQWLAHIEQHPGQLPHTAWLHVATQYGVGRNWLGGLLARVFAGSVAVNFDLAASLKSGFNDRLSRKVLVVVDEINEGGSDVRWAHAETVKRMLTEEQREINPKFGRKSVEFNACRMLLFSNHVSAIPIQDEDRRFEVVVMEDPPRSAEVYSTLYNALDVPEFVAAVAGYLGQVDLHDFNPGRRAVMNESKSRVIEASRSSLATWVKSLKDHWPVDLITSNDLYQVLEGADFSFGTARNLTPAHRYTLTECGIRSREKPIKIDKTATRVQILRNPNRWLRADPTECRAELERWRPPHTNLRQVLLEISAEEG